MSLEKTILSGMIGNENYLWKVLPHIKGEYFTAREYKIAFDLVSNYANKYNRVPEKAALFIDLDKQDGLTEELFKKTKDLINELSSPPQDFEWLVDNTEQFCQSRALHLAIYNAISILDNKSKDLDKGAIPQLLTDALGVSFDTNIGHDFLEDAEERFDFYHRVEEKIPFDLDYMNLITGNGIAKKTLTVILAGTGVGKSMMMCHMAAHNLLVGKNVLYVTMEMAEERIAERIDANTLNITMDDLAILPKESYMKKIERVRGKTSGRLVIKEYPTSQAGSGHFRHLLNELKQKKSFVPDIVYIDYINICASSRMKMSGSVNSYTYIKAIAEELRGLAMEFNLPIVTATQTTRSGYDSSDVNLTDTSESFGLPATADLMFAIMSSEELEQLGQVMIKQLKNRYKDPSRYKRFVLGLDKPKMRFYNVEQTAQKDITDSGPVMDQSDFGQRMKAEKKFDFDNFK
jgi:replicative DNA helicase